MRRATFVLVAATVITRLSVPSEALAQPSASERALEAAYEADGLFARGKWQEAYDRFEEADRLAHSPVFVLYMARALRNAGALVEARALYERVIAEKVGADAPKPFRAALTDAAAELAEVKAKTPRVRVDVRGVSKADVVVKVDDAPIAVDTPTPLDPGAHVFVARAGEREVRRDATLTADGAETAIVLDFAEKGAPIAAGGSEGSYVPGIIALSVGGLGLALGTVTGAIAASQASDIKEGCIDGHCLEEDADALETASTLATVSTVGFIAGGACVVAGIVLVAVRPGGDDGTTTVSFGPSGVLVRGTF